MWTGDAARRFPAAVLALALAVLVGHIDRSADAAGHLSALSQQQLVADDAPLVGLSAHFDSGDFALVYRGVSQAGYDLTVASNLSAQLPIGLPALHLHGVTQYDPRQVTLEAASSTK